MHYAKESLLTKYFIDVLSRRIDEVVHGGTKQLGDFNETPTAEDTAHILKVTSEFVPSLKVSFLSLTAALDRVICMLTESEAST